jgi:malate dehydrogenase
MTIWGNHSATQYPDLYRAQVGGKSVASQIDDKSWIEETFLPTVQERGKAIIEARGLSSAASAANAAIDHIRDWHHGTDEGDWVSMAVRSDGSYGIPEDLIYGFPCRCSGGKFEIVTGLEIDDFSRAKMDATAAELAEEAEAVKDLV